MRISLAPTSTSKFVYCSADKSRYIYDDPISQCRVGCLAGGEEKYEFRMKDGTKNTLQRALSRSNGASRSYLRSKYDSSRIWLESIDAEDLMADLYNMDIISEDEFIHYRSTTEEMVCGDGMIGDMGRVPDQPNIYQAFKSLGQEKWEKAQHLEGEERDIVLKRSEMFTRLADILKSIYGEVQGIVTNEMMCKSFERSLQEIDAPYFSDEKNQEVLTVFLEKTKDDVADALDEMASPRESAQERYERLHAWEKEQFYQRMRDGLKI